MTPDHRRRLDDLIAFHADLKQYAVAVDAYEQSVRDWDHSPYTPEPHMSAELEQLRQDLLKRSGAVRPLFRRLAGRILQPGPFHSGMHDAWDLALIGHPDFYRTSYATNIADVLLTVIGRLEADPALLDPPMEARPPTGGAVLQPITVYGGTVNIAQTAAGDISQTNTPQQDLTDVRRLLAELESAIRNLQAPEDEIEGFLEPVEELSSELAKSTPLVSRLTRSWGSIQAFAVLEGAWQGWDRIQHIAGELGPKAHDLIQTIARTTGNA